MAHGVELFFKIHSEREKVDTVSGSCRGCDVNKHRCLAVFGENRGICQLAELSGFENQRTTRQRGFIAMDVVELFLFDYH